MATLPNITTPSIAVIDDDPVFLQLMELILQMDGYHMVVRIEGEDAFDMLIREKPDLVILDIRVNRDARTGWQILERMRAEHIVDNTPVIVCTADVFFLRRMSDRLLQYGYLILEKPFNIQDLEDCITEAFASA